MGSTLSDYTVLDDVINKSQLLTNSDAACGSGIIIRSTINRASTGIRVVQQRLWLSIYVQTRRVQYGTLVFDRSCEHGQLGILEHQHINVIALDFAAPTIRDSTFTLGDDGRGYDAAAVRAYGPEQVFSLL